MKKFIIFSKLRSLFLKADKALGKYIEPRRGDYNFLDVVSNIKLTEAQINEEIHKHHQRNRQIPMLLTLVSLLFAYLPKIISYIFKNEIVGVWEYLLFGIYTLSLIAVVLFFFFFGGFSASLICLSLLSSKAVNISSCFITISLLHKVLL